MATRTNGNIIVEEIKVGDIHYDFDLGFVVKCEVLTLPERDSEGGWTWRSKSLKGDNIVEYFVKEGMSHYAPKLYDYEAYTNCKDYFL